MSTHKHFDKICYVVLALTLLLTVLFLNAERFGVEKASTVMGYEDKLFSTSTVHTIDIRMEDWDEFIEGCESEEYSPCTVVIDDETYQNVAIRAKGNTSLTQVKAYGNDRYSFKIEFDRFNSSNTYYGLDKLCLNNIIQDNTYMKDYLTYQMMGQTGVASPLCSYVYITVNGEDWGLYLAVESIEESFLQRNYGKNYGELYKPDSMNLGGGRGNGEKFDMAQFQPDAVPDNQEKAEDTFHAATPSAQPPQETFPGNSVQEVPTQKPMQENDVSGDINTAPSHMPNGQNNSRSEGLRGSDDVLLKYIDDDIDSYANIFDNAKTDASSSDKRRLIQSLKKLSQGEALSQALDMEKVIRYFVVHNFVLNFDSYTGSMIHNYYLYEKDGQLQMIPWDYNLAFGGFQSMADATALVNYPIDSPVSGGNVEDRPMLAWIFADEEYTALYHSCFSEFLAAYFDNSYFETMIDQVSTMIAPYVEQDPSKFCTYEEFEKGVSALKAFCLLRAESISGQLDGTIGSTSATQDPATLIDASDLQIGDMGSMNTGKEGKMGRGNNMAAPTAPPSQDNQGNGNARDDNGQEGSSTAAPAMGQPQNNATNRVAPAETPRPGEKGQRLEPMQKQSFLSNGDKYLLLASLVVLLLGLVFAFRYPRRR